MKNCKNKILMTKRDPMRVVLEDYLKRILWINRMKDKNLILNIEMSKNKIYPKKNQAKILEETIR